VSQQSARYQRSSGGMVGALLVLLVLILAYLGLQALTGNRHPDPVHAVAYSQDVPAARKAADFPLLAPPELPRGWRATTVSFAPPPDSHWHLGVLTAADRYVGLEQGHDSVRSMVRAYVDEAAERGRPVDVEGSTWASYTDSGGDLALVRRSRGTTTLVVGHDVTRSDLAAYTARLR
jgi:Protein of unknown function (DUF4245)